MEPTGDEAALRGVQDALPLCLCAGGGGGVRGGGGKGIKRHCSS